MMLFHRNRKVVKMVLNRAYTSYPSHQVQEIFMKDWKDFKIEVVDNIKYTVFPRANRLIVYR